MEQFVKSENGLQGIVSILRDGQDVAEKIFRGDMMRVWIFGATVTISLLAWFYDDYLPHSVASVMVVWVVMYIRGLDVSLLYTLPAWVDKMRSILLQCGPQDARDVELARRVEEELYQRRCTVMRLARHFAAAFSLACLMAYCCGFISMSTGKFTWTFGTPLLVFCMFTEQFPEVLPVLLSNRGAKLLTFFHTCRLMLFLSMATDFSGVQRTMDNFRYIRLVYVIAASDLSHIIVSNATFSTLALIAYTIHGANGVQGGGLFLGDVFVDEFRQCFIAVFFWYALDSQMKATISASMEKEESHQAKETIEKLLLFLCDAVVTLDSDLKIIEQCPKLSALLLSGRALQGQSFVDLMPPDEKSRLVDHMQWSNSSEHALCLSTRLVASADTLVHVNLFHVSFWDVRTAQYKHLMGVAEVQTMEIMASCAKHGASSDSTGIQEDLDVDEHLSSSSSSSSEPHTKAKSNRSNRIRSRHRHGRVKLDSLEIALPQFEETPRQTLKHIIGAAIPRCNLRGKGCCYMHLGLKVVEQVAREMQSYKCGANYEPLQEWQCSHCKSLAGECDSDEFLCEVCGC